MNQYRNSPLLTFAFSIFLTLSQAGSAATTNTPVDLDTFSELGPASATPSNSMDMIIAPPTNTVAPFATYYDVPICGSKGFYRIRLK